MRLLGYFLLFFLVRSSLAAAIFVVAPYGNDQNKGTEQEPWRTVQHAADQAMPGSTVYIRNGTYKEQVHFTVGGNHEEGSITFASYPKERAVISGSLSLHDKSYVCIQGIEVCDGALGIEVSGKGEHVDLVDNVIHEVRHGRGIGVKGTVSHVRIQGNEVYDCKTGLSLADGVEYFVVSQNYVHDITYTGISLSDGTKHGICKLNKVIRTQGDGIGINEAHHVMVSQNEVGNCGVGIGLSGKTVEEIVVLKNEIHDNQKSGVALADGVHHATFTKNKILRNDASHKRNGEIHIQGSSDNNFFENTIRPNQQHLIIHAGKGQNQFNQNTYLTERESSIWIWNGIEHAGFQEFQEETGQESQAYFY